MVTELRLIRAEMRRIGVNAHRSQVVLERIKLQQEQVAQIRHEIADVRDKLDDVRGQQLQTKKLLEKAAQNKDVGLGDDSAVKAVTGMAEELERREQSLTSKEVRLAAELSAAEANVAALNGRLDEIELEMAQPGPADDGQPSKSKQ